MRGRFLLLKVGFKASRAGYRPKLKLCDPPFFLLRPQCSQTLLLNLIEHPLHPVRLSWTVPAWRPPVASVCTYVIVQNATAHRRQVLLNASVKVGAVLIWWDVPIGFWGSCSDNFTGFKDSGAVFFSWCLLWFVIDGWMWAELQQWCNSCCLKTKRGCFCFPARIPAKELREILWRCVGISINIRYFVFPFIKVD